MPHSHISVVLPELQLVAIEAMLLTCWQHLLTDDVHGLPSA